MTADEREIANLDAIEVEASWVAGCLADFDKVWNVLTPENRGVLLRAVVQRVEVDDPANKVSVFITDLSAACLAPRRRPSPCSQRPRHDHYREGLHRRGARRDEQLFAA